MTQSSPAIVEALQLAYHELKLHDADYHHRTSVEVNNKIVDALGEAAKAPVPTEMDLTKCMRKCWPLIADGLTAEDFFAAAAVMIQDHIRHMPSIAQPSRNDVIEECARAVEAYGDAADGSRNDKRRMGIAAAVRALSIPSTHQPSGVMAAAEKAAQVVEGWSDAKKDYAARTMSSPTRETPGSLRPSQQRAQGK